MFSGISIYDRLFGAVPQPQESLYVEKAADRDKQYIGRAGRTGSGQANANEFLWCLKADMSRANKTLPKRTRIVMAYRYVCDYSDETISDLIGVSERTVQRIISAGLDQIATFLDSV